MKYAYPNLSRRGLCNMLFTWAQAVSYCHYHNATMISPVWARISRIGPWLRGERYKRYYGGEFTNEGYVSGIRRWFLLNFRKESVKIFSGMDGFFNPFLKDQEIVKKELNKIVNPNILAKVDGVSDEGAFIGVHVRRGDFSSVGLSTPDSWFLSAIDLALSKVKIPREKVIIRVFTDGYPNEVAFIADAYKDCQVVVMPKAPAIQDLLLLARSSIVVCSPQSTFSMWAVYLGQMPSVWKKDVSVPQMYLENDLSLFV